MVPRSTPDSRIHTSSVDPDSASGRPDEKPSSNTIRTRRCRYTARPSRQEARGARSGFLIEADAASGAVIKGCYQIRAQHIILSSPGLTRYHRHWVSSSAKADDPVFREARVQHGCRVALPY